MKNLYLLLIALVCFAFNGYAQDHGIYEEAPVKIKEGKSVITAGFWQGGNSLIGADYERLITKRIGVQVGAGLIGFDTGVNFHFAPNIKSSFIHVGYWQQGVGATFDKNLAVVSYVYRSKKCFTAQLGVASILSQGVMAESVYASPMQVVASVGAYFVIK